MRFDVAVRRIQGGRPYQEDRCLVLDLAPGGAGEAALDVTDASDEGGAGPARVERAALVVLADGMGGAAGGAVASDTASRAFAAAFGARLASRSPDDPPRADDGGAQLGNALLAANEAVAERARLQPELRGMGCTFIGATLEAPPADEGNAPNGFGGRGPVGWMRFVSVGDSLLMRVRDGEFHRVNDDHSLARELDIQAVERNTPDAWRHAMNHEQRPRLTSALMGEPLAAVQGGARPILPGDLHIFASDGIETLDYEQIRGLARHLMPQGAGAVAEGLVRAVEALGLAKRQDNTTVIAVLAHDDASGPVAGAGAGAAAASPGAAPSAQARTFVLPRAPDDDAREAVATPAPASAPTSAPTSAPALFAAPDAAVPRSALVAHRPPRWFKYAFYATAVLFGIALSAMLADVVTDGGVRRTAGLDEGGRRGAETLVAGGSSAPANRPAPDPPARPPVVAAEPSREAAAPPPAPSPSVPPNGAATAGAVPTPPAPAPSAAPGASAAPNPPPAQSPASRATSVSPGADTSRGGAPAPATGASSGAFGTAQDRSAGAEGRGRDGAAPSANAYAASPSSVPQVSGDQRLENEREFGRLRFAPVEQIVAHYGLPTENWRVVTAAGGEMRLESDREIFFPHLRKRYLKASARWVDVPPR